MATARTLQNGLLRNALLCILPAVLVTGVAARAAMGLLDLDAAYLTKILILLLLGATAIMAGLPRHHPFGTFGPANQATVARGALVAMLAGLIGERADTGAPALATAVAIVAALLDAADGWLARRAHMSSGFGARFDMETDAALILVLSVLAWQFGKAGPWVLASGLLRYAFVASGLVWPLMRRRLAPSKRRRIIAVVQVIALIVAGAPFIPVGAAAPMAAAALVALAVSFLIDVAWLINSARQERERVAAL